MAIRRFTLAADNHPAFGFVKIDEISRGGDFFIETGWTPQAAIVALAQQFNLAHEFVPYSGSILYRLEQTTPGAKTYNIFDNIGISGGSAATISSFEKTSVISVAGSEIVSSRTWNLFTTSAGEADQVVFQVGDLTAETDLYAIVHDDDEVDGNIIYFGAGTDVSATYDLDPGTRWETATSVTVADNIAEMIFVDGTQIEGDIYSIYYEGGYGGGEYDMIVNEDGTVHIQFVNPIDTGSQNLMFVIFERAGEPFVTVKMLNEDETEADPFEILVDEDGTEHRGVRCVCGNIPKGDMMVSYYIV